MDFAIGLNTGKKLASQCKDNQWKDIPYKDNQQSGTQHNTTH